jgi:hypothetical protein
VSKLGERVKILHQETKSNTPCHLSAGARQRASGIDFCIHHGISVVLIYKQREHEETNNRIIVKIETIDA